MLQSVFSALTANALTTTLKSDFLTLTMSDSDSLPFQTEVSSLAQKMRQILDSDAPLPLPLTIGPYLLIRKLGRGGMGEVYEAENTSLHRREAIKFVRSKFILNPTAIERFRQEIDATAKLQHPNIVSVYNAGQYEGRPFMVMEFLEGQTVHQYVQQRVSHGAPLSLDEAVNIIVQAARGLQYAHEKGIIHRDVKPGNLWIAPDNAVKALDLGLAFAITNNSQGEQIAGTPDYMSPEQTRCSETPDARSDIYSLGCTLFYILTGQAPFGIKEYSSSEKKMEAQRSRPLPPLNQFRKDVPQRIQKILNRMTAKDAADRYASMNDVIKAFENKPIPWGRILTSAGAILLLCTAIVWGVGDKTFHEKSEIAPVQTPQSIPDVIPDFPAGKQPGEKRVCVVDGVEYVFRWCPPGSFMMGNHGVLINEMSIEELLKFAKDNRLLDQKELNSLKSRFESITNNSTHLKDNASIELNIFRIDLVSMLSINSDINSGSPPQKRIIQHGFWTLDCEVTRKMWFSVLKKHSSNSRIELLNESDNVPVRNISWLDAQDFCKALGAKLKQNVELLTEAQWEYACRANEEQTPELVAQQSVSFENSLAGPATVKIKAPNAWGIYDMPGNVREWCADSPDSADLPASTNYPDRFGKNGSDNSDSNQRLKLVRGGCYLERRVMEDFFSICDYIPENETVVTVGVRVCIPLYHERCLD